MNDHVDHLKSAIEIMWHDFDPEDIARVSGLSIDLQKLWRSRGVIPKKTGTRVRYSPSDAAKFTLVRIVQSNGCSQAQAIETGEKFKDLLLKLAMLDGEGAVAIVGTPPFVTAFLKSWENSEELSGFISGCQTSVRGRILISADGADFEIASRVPDLDLLESPTQFTAINLAALARVFVNAFGKPFVLVQEKLEPGSKAPRIRKLTGPPLGESVQTVDAGRSHRPPQ